MGRVYCQIMDYVISCVGCGHPVLHTDETEEKEAYCPKCGSGILYQAKRNVVVIRMDRHAGISPLGKERMLKISCPECGRLIGSAAEGTRTDTVCPKCKTRLEYCIESGAVCLQKK